MHSVHKILFYRCIGVGEETRDQNNAGEAQMHWDHARKVCIIMNLTFNSVLDLGRRDQKVAHKYAYVCEVSLSILRKKEDKAGSRHYLA